MGELKHRKLWFTLGYVLLAVVAYLSLAPITTDVPASDKTLHFVTYCALSAFFTSLVQLPRSLWLVAAGLVSFGVLMEILQGLTGYRLFELMDMLANSLGVLAGLLTRLTPMPIWLRRIEARLLQALGRYVLITLLLQLDDAAEQIFHQLRGVVPGYPVAVVGVITPAHLYPDPAFT